MINLRNAISHNLFRKCNSVLVSYRFCELPKATKFSHYLGLAKELEDLHRSQVKSQAFISFTYTSVIVAIFAIFGTCMFICVLDNKTNFKVKLISKLLQHSMTSNNNMHHFEQYVNILEQTMQSFSFNCYDLLLFISYCADKQKLRHCHKNTIISIQHILKIMIINNDKCKRSDRFKEIATILLEFVVEGKLDAFSFVAEFMIQYGNLKQMYLAKHFYMAGQFNGFSKQVRNQIDNNLKTRIQKRQKTYDNIFSELKQSKLPQLAFKHQLQSKWIVTIQQFLSRSSKIKQS